MKMNPILGIENLLAHFKTIFGPKRGGSEWRVVGYGPKYTILPSKCIYYFKKTTCL